LQHDQAGHVLSLQAFEKLPHDTCVDDYFRRVCFFIKSIQHGQMGSWQLVTNRRAVSHDMQNGKLA